MLSRTLVADRTGSSRIANALTVDVEDYFHVQAFADHIARKEWDELPARVEGNTQRLLELFGDRGVRATFFILGWVAERFPEVVRRIAAGGHEVGSHGWQHTPVYQQTAKEFRIDVRRTKAMLEDISGECVRGYRAASFSMTAKTVWAYEVLKEEGYGYSSSVYPIRHDLYGMVDAPRFTHMPRGSGGVPELPITTTVLLGHNVPCGGGGYFRLLPYHFFRWGLRRVNGDEGRSCIFYIHPWEIDPEQPRQNHPRLRARFRHYVNLHRTYARLERLLGDFAWDRVDQVYKCEIAALERSTCYRFQSQSGK
jgi:polysaccharide deacetylase family protein (PEP-CTERM system associated)